MHAPAAGPESAHHSLEISQPQKLFVTGIQECYSACINAATSAGFWELGTYDICLG